MKIVRTSPLASAQLGLWFKYQMAPHSMAFTVEIACRLLGQLEPGRLQESIQSVADASDALRTFFGSEDGEPVQHVRDRVQAPTQVHAVPCSPEAVAAWAARPFDITCDVLFETLLIQESPGCWTWRTRFSHLVMDGVGGYAYVNAVAQAYAQLENGRKFDPGIVGNYGEHLAADTAYRASPRWQEDRGYWQARHPAPAEPVFRPGRGTDVGFKFHKAEIVPDRYGRFLDACTEEGLPAVSVLTSILALVAMRHQGRIDFSMAIASHNRGSAHRSTLGMFSGYLPFRIGLDSTEVIAALARRIDAQLRRDLRRRIFTIDQLVGAGNAEAEPVFDLVLSYVRRNAPATLGNVRLDFEHVGGCDSDKVFLLVHEQGIGKAAEITLSYPPHLTDEDEVEAFFHQFLRLADQWADIRRLRADQVPLLDAPELQRLVDSGDGARRTVAASSDVLSRFDRQALMRPAAKAVACNGTTTSYGRLYERSLLLAAHLRSLGVGPDSVVGVRLERGEELVVALLSILRAQGAYLPLDTSIPGERLDYMLDNSGARLLLTTSSLAAGAGATAVVCLDELMVGADACATLTSCAADADQLAYVIYTSGSTGQPKGVQISRGALANAMASFEHDLQAGAQEVFLSTTAISFDIFGLELFLPLCTGATLVLADRERLLETDYLPGLARDHRATLFQATPSLMRNLLDAGWQPCADLRLLVGGESLALDVAQRLGCARSLFNVYGPTEATIWASMYRVHADCDRSPPIGRPIWNTQLYVLDSLLEPLPEGATGELYIGGVQLARGYARRPDLTADRFVPNPFAAGERLYRTGDLARWRTDGELEYLGRADQQVKIRGHRIEPGEIETVLAAHPAVAAAAVVPRDDLPGVTQLVAYYIPDAAHEDAIENELACKQTAAWRDVYDSRYAQDANQESEADAAVWTNSYTGRPYSTEDMREWADATVSRIASLQPQHVLEVGCGSGLLMFPLAPGTQRYVGTDISGKALELLAHRAATMPQIELRHLPAHCIGALAPETFDLIVLNSVVQYFPGASYLLDVLDQAYSLLAPGGHLFVGDVRNLGLLPAFRASLEIHRRAAAPTCGELKREVQRQCRHESELCLDPAFFATLAGRYQLHSVQVLSRRGVAETEMNAFRFDAVLRRASARCTPATAVELEMLWQPAQWSLPHLQALLEGAPREAFVLRGLPDARVQHGVTLLEAVRLGQAEMEVQPAGDVMWIHPEAVTAMARRMQWSATVRATRADGTFDVLLAPVDPATPAPLLAEPAVNQPLRQFAGRPLAPQIRLQVEQQLRRHLEGLLPDYMVPAFFMPLAHLPLTTSGKLDRRALPKPEVMEAGEVCVPCNGTEAKVAEVMARVLGLPRPPGREASFFALGGHSLAAVRLVAQLRETFGTDVGLKAVFESPTVAGLTARLLESGKVALCPLVVHEYGADSCVALSASQAAIWFLDRLQGPSAVYSMPYAFRLNGPLDVAALEHAFTALVQRHTVLRTVCAEDEGTAFGVVQAARPFQLRVLDAGLPVRALVQQAAQAPFDLSRDLMLRGYLAGLDGTTHVLVIVVHHIAADGLSMDVMTRELGELYAAAREGHAATLAPLAAQYADYAHWQCHWLESEEPDRQLDWWRFHLQDAPAVLNLPLDRPRPAASRNRGAQFSFRVGAAQRAAVERLAVEHGITPFSVLLAAYGTLLSRLSRQSEVVVGTPAGGRRLPQLDGLIGFFVNVLPLRLEPGMASTCAELLRSTADALQGGLSHADVPFDRLVQHLGTERLLNQTPIFQAMFSYLARETALELPGLAVQAIDADSGTSRFDLTLQLVVDAAAGYTATFEFDTDLFEPATIERWAGHYRCVVQALTDAPDSLVADLPLDDAEQTRLIVGEWNAKRNAVPPCPDVLELFEFQARRQPGAAAVVSGDASISYGELEAKAGRLAYRLRELGARPESVVGIHLERGIALMIAIMGVMKSGAAYLPLDTALPADRLAYMLDNSRTALVLTSSEFLPALAQCGSRAQAFDIDKVLSEVQAPGRTPSYGARDSESLAYVIYTSGSTGRPKGVEISHGSLAVFNEVFRDAYEIRSSDVVLSITSISFDIFVPEIFSILAVGARVVMADRQRLLDAGYFEELARKNRATVLVSTPSLLRNLLDSGWKPSPLMRLMTGGEGLPQDLGERLCSLAPTWNAYGPTEATVAQSAARLRSPVAARPSIGGPFPGTSMYVLDARLHPVPIGVLGELYIGGAQLARGYAGRPDLTAEKFMPDPFATGERMYRTGDVVRWRPDGELEHFGRADRQVKVRGQRIELSEIEASLASHGSVEAVAVIAREDRPGDTQLVAYVVTRRGEALEAQVLRDHLYQDLPAYMIPAAFVALQNLPVTRNGKLDLRALPMPDWLAAESHATAEFDFVEEQVAQLMAQVLGLDAIAHPQRSFFELGGHSLSAVRLAVRLREVFGIEVPLKSIFKAATVAGLARYVRSHDAAASQSPFVCFDEDSHAAPLFIVHGADGNAVNFRKLAQCLAPHAKVYGLDCVHIWNPQASSHQPGMEQLARLYADSILTEFPDLDEIRLGGWSFGGLVALEMARYLTEKGHKVTTAFAIDSALHWAAAELLSAISLDNGESVARQHLMETGQPRKEIDALLADNSPTGFLARLSAAFKSHAAAMVRYRPRPYGSKFALILADKGTALDARSLGGWRTALGDLLVERTIAGTHWSILQAPGVQALAHEIARVLAQADEVVS
jgi:amino acid adenylation domain-containing protein